jgi:broad specificity phosphatase PhoE/ribonuclease HI
MPVSLIVEADGGSRGNPGPAGYGAVVRDATSGAVLAERYASLGVSTNNVAEYAGLVAGLTAAAELAPGADVEVRMDSKLVVEQMSGRWQIKHPGLRPLAAQAGAAAGRLGQVSYRWVPRARNAHADRLANLAMDEAAGKQAAGKQAAGKQAAGKQAAGTEAAGKEAAGKQAAGTGQPADGARSGAEISATGRPAAAGRPGPSWAGAQPEPLTTVLLRHGETPLSAERRFAGRGDIPLTEAGLAQARAAARRLAARGPVQRIVSSPLQRARRTAAEVAAATGVPVEVDDGWMETDFGEWEGLSFAEAMERWPDEVTAWLKDTRVPPPGGESFDETGRRVLAALDRVRAGRPAGTVVVVSHVTPIKTVLRHALLAPPEALRRMFLSVACLSEVDWYADGPAVVRTLNDTAHLGPA